MRRPYLFIVLAIAASLLVAEAIQYEKLIVLLFFRVQDNVSPRDSSGASNGSTGESVRPESMTFDFGSVTRPGNYFFEQTVSPSHTFENMGPATVHIAGLRGKVMTLQVFATRVFYVEGKLELLKLFTTADGTTYAHAVESVVSSSRSLGILSDLETDDYAQHLDAVPDQEVWVPRFPLGDYEASAWLNCSWSGTMPARVEILTTRCRPYLSIEHRPARADGDKRL